MHISRLRRINFAMAISLVLTLALGVAEQELPPTEAVAPDAEPTEEYMYCALLLSILRDRAIILNSDAPSKQLRNYSQFSTQRNYSTPIHPGVPTSAPTATTGTATTAASARSTTCAPVSRATALPPAAALRGRV